MIIMEEYLTVKEVAQELRVSVETVKRMLRKGDLPGRKVGISWRIRVTDYEEWKNQKPSSPEESAQEN